MIPDLLDSNNRPTLVDIAKAIPRKRRPRRRMRWDSSTTDQLIELSILWASDGLSYGQCMAATGLHGNNFYSRMAYALRLAVRNGRLVDSKTARGWK